eukprot:Tbor_TRINITY_DN5240_c1_g1::TRINITY_DN5240_c1_g1_i2::g.16741::m.16741
MEQQRVTKVNQGTSVDNTSKRSADTDTPLIARIINHMLTPGSSLNFTIWISFNCIMGILFIIWLMFFIQFPTSVHLSAFAFLGGGLGASTNYVMYQVLLNKPSSKESKEEKDVCKQEDKNNNDNNDAPIQQLEQSKPACEAPSSGTSATITRRNRPPREN